MAREARTNFTGDTDDLERAGRRASDAIDGVGEAGESAGRRLRDSFVVTAGDVGNVLGTAVRMGADFVMAAADDERAAAALATTMRNVIRATDGQVSSADEWVESTSRATGVMDNDLRDSLATAVRLTGDLESAQSVVTTAMDIAAGSGQDLGSVIEAVAGQQRGETDALESMGIATQSASGEMLALDQVLQSASQTFGGQMAASTETMSGQLAIAQANFDSMKEEMGARLLPVLTTVVQFIVSDLVPAIESASAWVEERWPAIRDTAQEVWGGFVAFAQAAWEYISPIVMGIYDVIAGFVTLVKNIFEGDWSDAWDGAVRMVSGAWDAIRGLLDLIGDAVHAMGIAAFELLTGLATGIVDWFQDLGGDIIDAMGRGILAAGGMASDFATDFANTIIRFINTQLIDRINETVSFTIDPPGPGSFSFSPTIPHIPTLDTGGIVTGPTLAALSMNGIPEVVVPLPRLESMMGGGRGGSATISLYGDTFSADQVEQALFELEARHGGLRITVDRARAIAA